MQKSLLRAPLWLALFASCAAFAQPAGTPAYERKAAAVYRADAGRALGQALFNNHGEVVAGALRAQGSSEASLAALREAGAMAGRDGITHRRFEQTVAGLPVYGAYAKAAFNRNGELVHLIDHLAAVPQQALAAHRVSAEEALNIAMLRLHAGVQAQFRSLGRNGLTESFDGGAFFLRAPTVSAVAIPHTDGSMSQGWLVQTWSQRQNLLDHTLVGGDGRVLDIERRTASDSYLVFTNDPDKGGQVTVSGPGAGNAQSPSGWLAGPQSTLRIAGNNVDAHLDRDANNSADGGGTSVTNGDFLAAANFSLQPTSAPNQAVAVQNLFYLNNVIHDLLYSHGFNEASANFQINNFGLGGAANDAVQADAQDGEGLDNANFATPPDGQAPRMQMFLWSSPLPTDEVVITSPGSALYQAKAASFGQALTSTGLVGRAMQVASPADGCKRINAAVSGKVAIVARGTCDFTVKVKNAQAAGAVAVIVTNSVADPIFSMGGTATASTIPSVMISLADGNALRSLSNPVGTLRKKAAQPLLVDAALDSDIVFHEYCHGLTWRLIGGMSGPLAGAVGEGMSDGCALLINGDAPNGDRVGEYSLGNSLGIRSAPYTNYPRTYGDVAGTGVHFDGEVYAATVWELMQQFGPARRSDLWNLLIDGMKLTPATPKFENMRDGILAAADPGDICKVWNAFAKFGIGVGAKATIRGTRVSVTQSFAKGNGCP